MTIYVHNGTGWQLAGDSGTLRPKVCGTAVSVTSIVDVGTTATVTTSAAHGFSNGLSVTIAGVTAVGMTALNGAFTITVTGTTTFTFTSSGVTDGTASNVGITASPWQPVTEVYIHDGTSWRLSYQYDNTAPTASTPTATRVSTGATMTVNYGTITDSESGITSVKLYRRYYYNGAYDSTTGTLRATIYSGAAVASISASSYADSISTAIRKNPTDNKDYTVYYRLEMTDAAGNVGYTSWSTGVPTKPFGTFTINPSTSVVYSVDNGNWYYTNNTVISGWFDTGNGYQNGYLFYGAQFPNTCVGYSPASASIYFIRNGAFGSSGNNYFCAHAHETQPGGAPAPMTAYMTTGPNLTGSNAAATWTIPSTWYDEMASGSILGFATRGGSSDKVTNTTSYRQLQPITTSGTGDITMVFD